MNIWHHTIRCGVIMQITHNSSIYITLFVCSCAHPHILNVWIVTNTAASERFHSEYDLYLDENHFEVISLCSIGSSIFPTKFSTNESRFASLLMYVQMLSGHWEEKKNHNNTRRSTWVFHFDCMLVYGRLFLRIILWII